MLSLFYFVSLILSFTLALDAWFVTEDIKLYTSVKISKILESLPYITLKKLTPDDLINHLDQIPELIICFRHSALFALPLKNFANNYQVPLIVHGKGVNSGWIFYTNPPNECLLNSTKVFMNKFKMNHFGILWDWKEENKYFVEKITKNNQNSKNFCLRRSNIGCGK